MALVRSDIFASTARVNISSRQTYFKAKLAARILLLAEFMKIIYGRNG
jgi:hypothetical protein